MTDRSSSLERMLGVADGNCSGDEVMESASLVVGSHRNDLEQEPAKTGPDHNLTRQRRDLCAWDILTRDDEVNEITQRERVEDDVTDVSDESLPKRREALLRHVENLHAGCHLAERLAVACVEQDAVKPVGSVADDAPRDENEWAAVWGSEIAVEKADGHEDQAVHEASPKARPESSVSAPRRRIAAILV